MKINPFFLQLTNVTGEQIGVATFSTLKALGWTLYNCGMLYAASTGVNIREMDLDTKMEMARNSFDFVASELPDDNPFAMELKRYISEVLPSAVPSAPLPPWLTLPNSHDIG